jgi:hypothetical protein
MKLRIILHSGIITKNTKNHSGEMERRGAKYLNGLLKYKRIALIFPLNGRMLNEPITPSKLYCYSIFSAVKIP